MKSKSVKTGFAAGLACCRTACGFHRERNSRRQACDRESQALSFLVALGFVMTLPVFSFAATNNNWLDVGGVFDGSYTNLAHWSLGHLPTIGEYFATANGKGDYTITFPQGEIASDANWNAYSGASDVITLDGRGTTFYQKAIDSSSYEKWYSNKLNDVISLERTTESDNAARKVGAYFTDFVCALSNRYHFVLKQGTFDYSKNGGRNTLFLNYYDGYSSLVVEKDATLLPAASMDWRCYSSHTRLDVNGGKVSGTRLNHPTSEGTAKYAKHTDELFVRNGGAVTFSSSVSIGNHAVDSAKRTFNLSVTDRGKFTDTSDAITHYYGNFNLLVSSGGVCDIASSVSLLNGTSGSYSGSVSLNDGGTLVCGRLICNAKNGSATFAADDATLSSKFAASDFFQGFASAKLGANGLTLETDYDVTVRQNLTNGDGVIGKLTKTGKGALTLSGSGSAFGSLSVEGGALTLSDDARVATALTVKNGATATLAAANGITSLTLGDDDTTGTLNLTASTTIAVEGVVHFIKPNFVLSGTFENGQTYDVLTAKGDCTAAKAAWADVVFRKGVVTGIGYETLSTTDDASGITTFSISVATAPNGAKTVSADETSAGAVSVTPYGTFDLTVDAPATYSLLNPLTAGFLTKDGAGTLSAVLSALDVYFGIVVKDGVLSIGGGNGTLLSALEINRKSGTTVVSTSCDVEVPSMNVVSGGWIKHGAGTLTVVNDGTAAQTLTATNGCVGRNGTPGGTVVRVGPGITPPTASWAGLSIAEGTLHLKGTGKGAKFNLKHAVAVGMPTGDVTEQPRLIVDNCEAYTGNNDFHFLLVPNLNGSNSANYPGCDAEVIVTNNGILRVDTLCVADTVVSARNANPKIIVDGGTLLSSFKLQFSRADALYYVPHYIFRNNAKVYTGHSSLSERTSTGVEAFGSTDMVVDNSVIGCASSYTPSSVGGLTIYISGKNNVTSWKFQNEAKFHCKQLGTSWDLKSATLTFDRATWLHDGGTNLCVEASNENALKLVVENGGLVLHADRGLRVQHPFIGSGTLTKTGSGKVWFDVAARYNAGQSEARNVATTLSCDVAVDEGELRISPNAASGTNRVTLAEGTVLDLAGENVGSLILAGAGNVGNGTLVSPTFVCGGEDVVTLANDVTVSGKAFLSFDEALVEPYPQSVLVANYEGEAPALGVVRVASKTGQPRLRAACTAVGGEIRANVYRSGMAVIVR